MNITFHMVTPDGEVVDYDESLFDPPLSRADVWPSLPLAA